MVVKERGRYTSAFYMYYNSNRYCILISFVAAKYNYKKYGLSITSGTAEDLTFLLYSLPEILQ